MSETTLPPEQVTASAADLQACALEPIHAPELIQNHGALMAFELSTGKLACASANLQAFMQAFTRGPDTLDPAHWRAQDLLARLDLTWEKAQSRLHTKGGPSVMVVTGHLSLPSLAVRVHEAATTDHKPLLVVEMMLDSELDHELAGQDDLVDRLTDIAKAVGGTSSVASLADLAVRLLQDLLSYRRVMIYEFDAQWNGKVIAEAAAPGVDQEFLGLQFPASDIPPQARALYERNELRVIGDAQAAPVPIVWEAGFVNGAGVLDQSHTLLRQPSPMHLHYLSNMGVQSSLVISLFRDAKLWGMLVCHHDRPRVPPHQLRASVLSSARFLSVLISNKLAENLIIEEAQHQTALRQDISDLHLLLGGATGLTELKSELLALISRGMACDETFCLLDNWCANESPPNAKLVSALTERHRQENAEVICTSNAGDEWGWPNEVWGDDDFSGVISYCSRDNPKLHIICLRKSQLVAVKWAGRPDLFTPIKRPDGSVVLGSRNSFATWVEEAGKSALDWTPQQKIHLETLSLELGRFAASRDLSAAQSKLDLMGAFIPYLQDMVLITTVAADTLLPAAIVYVNPAVVRHTGYQESELIGKPLDIFSGPMAEKTEPRNIKGFQHQAMPFQIRSFDTKKSGGRFWAAKVFTPIFGASGEVELWVCIQRDVTSNVRNQEEIERMNQGLEAAVASRTAELSLAMRDLESISYSMAHDLRGPLRSINGFAKILQEEFSKDLSGDAIQMLDRINFSTNKMAQMINDLLELMRVLTQDINVGPIAMSSLVDEALALLLPGDGSVQTEIGRLPPSRGDVRLVRQVVLNLLDNAIKYSSRQEAPRVRVGFDEAEQAYFVADNGIGMDLSRPHKLFDPFQRMHTDKSFTGSGIGLSIVARIIERHHGRIWVQSTPGVGTTFFWTLGR